MRIMGPEDRYGDPLFKTFICFYVCVIVWVLCGYVYVCLCPKQPEEGVRLVGTGVLGSSKLPCVGARNRT